MMCHAMLCVSRQVTLADTCSMHGANEQLASHAHSFVRAWQRALRQVWLVLMYGCMCVCVCVMSQVLRVCEDFLLMPSSQLSLCPSDPAYVWRWLITADRCEHTQHAFVTRPLQTGKFAQ